MFDVFAYFQPDVNGIPSLHSLGKHVHIYVCVFCVLPCAIMDIRKRLTFKQLRAILAKYCVISVTQEQFTDYRTHFGASLACASSHMYGCR